MPSVYKLKRWGERIHPCLTPLLTENQSDIPHSSLTAACCMNVHFCEFLVTGPVLQGMMKFNINKRYNGKMKRILSNQRLKYHIQVTNKCHKMFFFLFLNFVKTDIPCLFYSFGAAHRPVVLLVNIASEWVFWDRYNSLVIDVQPKLLIVTIVYPGSTGIKRSAH